MTGMEWFMFLIAYAALTSLALIGIDRSRGRS